MKNSKINSLTSKAWKTSRQVAKAIGLFRVRRVIRRASMGLSYYKANLSSLVKWVFQDSENSNFYYDLTENNEKVLVHLLATITNKPNQEIDNYLKEIKENQALVSRLENELEKSDYPRNIKVKFGRRIGWYALIRATKPRIVVETGIDHGIGLSVICEALKKNISEGFPGKYFGTDINTSAGQLSSSEYAEFSEILFGDSIESLTLMKEKIDIFINDSDHSAEYEYSEYQTITEKLSPKGIILGDNSHATDKLAIYSSQHNRTFYFFKEEPLNHWYPGAGIGISVNSKNIQEFNSVEFFK